MPPCCWGPCRPEAFRSKPTPAGRRNTLLATADGGLTPSTLLANSWAAGVPQPTGSSLGLLTLLGQGVRGDPRWVRVGYMQQWNLSLQREFPGHVLVEASYVGSRGVK